MAWWMSVFGAPRVVGIMVGAAFRRVLKKFLLFSFANFSTAGYICRYYHRFGFSFCFLHTLPPFFLLLSSLFFAFSRQPTSLTLGLLLSGQARISNRVFGSDAAVPSTAAARAFLCSPSHYVLRASVDLVPDLDEERELHTWNNTIAYTISSTVSSIFVIHSKYVCA